MNTVNRTIIGVLLVAFLFVLRYFLGFEGAVLVALAIIFAGIFEVQWMLEHNNH